LLKDLCFKLERLVEQSRKAAEKQKLYPIFLPCLKSSN